MTADTLHVPHPEQVATSNAWAFQHWLRASGRADLNGWKGLIAWSAADPAGFTDALTEFAGLSLLNSLSATWGGEGRGEVGDAPIQWAERERSRAVRPCAEVLLHADLRPDDRVLVAAGPSWPWQLALRYRTQVVLARPLTPSALMPRAAEEQASVLVADAGTLPDAAFQRAGRRLDLARLRCVIALGGPLAPEARARVYTWLKSDVLLLARAGDRLWGSPLDPVPSRPGPPLSFFRPLPPALAPA
ncbi:MAG: hypothetical protein JOY66_15655 [Acetobacteraceae bacterium]|nr:hypothetical protein [Acetobacteraceae bacterium]